MKVEIDSMAWLPKEQLTSETILKLKEALTVVPRKVGQHPGLPPGPIPLYKEEESRLGIARAYFFQNKRQNHEVILNVSHGDKTTWPGDLKFSGNLRPAQELGLRTVTQSFKDGTMGGIVRAPCGFGKTVVACSIMAELNVPTLVVVHKEFLVEQWIDRMEQFLPGVKIGKAQSDRCDFEGKNVVVGMIHSLAGRDYGEAFTKWPGLVVFDEVHRAGAPTWSVVPAKFPAKYRLGISATPKRRDGADDVFNFHIGNILYAAREMRAKPKIRRVWTGFKLVATNSFNPNLLTKIPLLQYLCLSDIRNKQIVEQLIMAVKADRKVLVLSERLRHLSDLKELFEKAWPDENLKPTTGFYVGGMEDTELEMSERCQVIFATSQFAQEGLDIPALDTLFLTTPLSDVQQACGRILRVVDGVVKKDPIIVDFRDEALPVCSRSAKYRDKYYSQEGWI